MTYDLRYQKEGAQFEELLSRGVPMERLAQWFREEPQLRPGDEFYLRAFWELSTERPVGAVVGVIPQSKIKEYASQLGLEDHMIGVLCRVIRKMDTAYLDWSRLEAEKQRKTAAAEGGATGKDGH